MGRRPARNSRSGGSAAKGTLRLPRLESVSLRTVAAEEKIALILQLLRKTAQNSRNGMAQPFYSIRAVANHFAVPVTTVSRIYDRLKDEGLLASVWGSKTFLEPTQIDKQLLFRAVVALPASIQSFCTLPTYRTFFLNIYDVLWRLGFAVRLVFYEGGDEEEPTFADLLLSYKIDVVIWFLPSPRSRNARGRLVDRGIHVITVVDSLKSCSEPCYYLSRHCALREGLIAWRKEGITSVIVARRVSGESSARLETIEAPLREVAMPYTIANINSCAPQDLLGALRPRKHRAIIFPSYEFLTHFSSLDSARLGKLLEQSRVMLLDGSIDFPLCPQLDLVADCMEFDWETIARRIGRDLAGSTRLPAEKPIIFEAKWIRRQADLKNGLEIANQPSR